MSSTITTTGPLFQAGGLASGLDTNSIVDKIIAAASAPMLQIQKQQAAYSVQISTVANLTSKLKTFQEATDTLATCGLAPIQPDSTYADFTVTGTAPSEGNYTIQVDTLARAAKMHSKSFTSAQDPAAVGLTGSLQFRIDGVTSPSTAINITGKSLADIAEAINRQVSQVTASVVSTGSGYRLSVIRKDTGYASTAPTALEIVSDPGLQLETIHTARNASLTFDGLPIERQTNSITGLIPGVTFALRGESNVATEVSFVRNTSAAAANIQSFITAYNDVVTLLNTQLRPDPSQAATNNPLAGSSFLSLERDMQKLVGQSVNNSGVVQNLSDLNVKMQDDGTLVLDQIAYQKTFTEALDADPQGANQIFTAATTGLGALVDTLVARQADPLDGALVGETKLLKDSVSSLDGTVAYWQVRLDNERARLSASFTAMEGTIATLNMASNYLNAMFYSGTSNTYKTTSNS